MKVLMNYFALLLIFSFYVVSDVYGQEDKACFVTATYNIRYDAAQDSVSGNSWKNRKRALFDLIKRYDFDIFGTQEGMFKQMIDFKNELSLYDYVSYPYGGRNDHHQNAIVYKRDVFKVEDVGVFWLSETPYVPSIGWDATDRRVCLWAKFKHMPSGRSFYFFNTHFYWKNEVARRMSGTLMVEMISQIAGNSPVICVGDFNSKSDTKQMLSINEILNDAYEVSLNGRKGEVNTDMGGGNFQGAPIARIDYIFLSKEVQVKDYNVYADQYADNRYPSDHLPVSCSVKF